MGNNTIKNHLVLHICKDILDHGVPENVNSAYAESAHILLLDDSPEHKKGQRLSQSKRQKDM
jgi:hypothetical protein